MVFIWLQEQKYIPSVNWYQTESVPSSSYLADITVSFKFWAF